MIVDVCNRPAHDDDRVIERGKHLTLIVGL